MCGIAGIFFNQDQDFSEKLFSESLELLKHRGPDSSGIKKYQKMCLGHQRLAIIDLNQNANQPFSDENFSLVFNGEIYNYQALRTNLEEFGIQFNTQSDTEVLFELLKREGQNCLEKLEGCFAFAFANLKDNTLLLARDRFGINPMYYGEVQGAFYFSSELRFIQNISKDFELSQSAIKNYFDLSYIPAPSSIYKNYFKLLPGTLLLKDDQTFKTEKYYSIQRKVNTIPSYDQSQNRLRSLLSEAVEKRLVSDVPIGSFLSGGIDSSIISLLASKSLNNLSTFSIGFEDAEFYDETIYAEIVAEKIKSNHKTIKLSSNDLIQSAKEILNHIDEPFADSSALAVNLLSKEVRKEIKVALSGDGADEIFSGYNKHKAENLLINRPNLKSILKRVPTFASASRDSKVANVMRQLEKLKEGAKEENTQRYLLWLSQLNMSKKVLRNPSNSSLFNSDIEIKDLNDILFWDTNIILSNDMLYKVDFCSMRNSLEVRTPFLDKDVVDFAFSLPPDFKLKGKKTKRILRDAFRDDLPLQVFTRGKKGFEIPLRSILLEGLNKELSELTDVSFIEEQKLFNFEYIAELLQKLKSSNPGNSAQQIWSLLVFQRFYLKNSKFN